MLKSEGTSPEDGTDQSRTPDRATALAHLLRKVAELLPFLHARARQAALEHLPAVDLRGRVGAGGRVARGKLWRCRAFEVVGQVQCASRCEKLQHCCRSQVKLPATSQ